MTAPVEYLDIDDVLALAARLLGAPVPIRDLGLLGSAVARPQTTVGGHDAYPDLWSKAAALLQSVVNNHALVDGNKRLGWLATAVFLELNGVNVALADNDDVYDLVITVASSSLTIDRSPRESRISSRPHPASADDVGTDRLATTTSTQVAATAWRSISRPRPTAAACAVLGLFGRVR